MVYTLERGCGGQKAQMVDLLGKGFKLAILNMFKELKESMSED